MVTAGTVLLVAPAAQAAFPGPDGVIVFHGAPPSTHWCRRHGQQLLAVEPGVHGVVVLTCAPGEAEHPSVSPDGSLVVLSSGTGSGLPQLFTLPLGTPPHHAPPAATLVSDDSGAGDTDPSWSPVDDGTIVFVRTLPGGLPQLFTENVHSPSSAAPLFGAPTGTADTEPVYDPFDPDVLVFVREVSGHTHIFSYDIADHVLTDLSAQGDGGGRADDAAPDFEPVATGGRIVFESDRACGALQLYTMTLQGTEQRPVFTSTRRRHGPRQLCTGTEQDPAYSPQGDALTFLANGQRRGCGQQVFVVSVDTNGDAAGPVTAVVGAGRTDFIDHEGQPNWGPAVDPPAQTPETPLPVALPVVAVGMLGIVVLLQRRRRTGRGARHEGVR
ncbi:MAG: hypothetical protein ABSG81_12520 [Acidimicrobiales bacterium]